MWLALFFEGLYVVCVCVVFRRSSAPLGVFDFESASKLGQARWRRWKM